MIYKPQFPGREVIQYIGDKPIARIFPSGLFKLEFSQEDVGPDTKILQDPRTLVALARADGFVPGNMYNEMDAAIISSGHRWKLDADQYHQGQGLELLHEIITRLHHQYMQRIEILRNAGDMPIYLIPGLGAMGTIGVQLETMEAQARTQILYPIHRIYLDDDQVDDNILDPGVQEEQLKVNNIIYGLQGAADVGGDIVLTPDEQSRADAIDKLMGDLFD